MQVFAKGAKGPRAFPRSAPSVTRSHVGQPRAQRIRGYLPRSTAHDNDFERHFTPGVNLLAFHPGRAGLTYHRCSDVKIEGACVSDDFVEYCNISGLEPLRQGDVLESVDGKPSMWQRHLLVITADCDFAHSKHQGRVTCIPILTTDEYFLEMAVPRLRNRLVKKPSGDLQKFQAVRLPQRHRSAACARACEARQLTPSQLV